MIVVDTSALMAILLDEPQANECRAALESDDRLLMSAGTVAEALIVSALRGIATAMEKLLAELQVEVVVVTSGFAVRVGAAYRRWGKGIHPAKLNFGDCFAYALAEEHACPLLYVGQDFARTDIAAVL